MKQRSEIEELIKASRPQLRNLIEWIQENLAGFEYLDIHQWYGRLWYVTVRDARAKTIPHIHPSDVRVGFTVDVQGDSIYWNDRTDINEPGGNCFARSGKRSCAITSILGLTAYSRSRFTATETASTLHLKRPRPNPIKICYGSP